MNTKLVLSTILSIITELQHSVLKIFLISSFVLVARPALSATFEWDAIAWCHWYESSQDSYIALMGNISAASWTWVASANGQMIGYVDNGTLRIKQYDRKTTWVGNDNVTFILAVYGELLSADTIEAATKLPLCTWDSHDHEGGIAIDDLSDFYLGFMTPESETADGMPRYGWYHLSIADDLNDITLLDSGVGLYGESVYVGIGPTPEPSSTVLILLGLAGLLLRRRGGVVGVDRNSYRYRQCGGLRPRGSRHRSRDCLWLSQWFLLVFSPLPTARGERIDSDNLCFHISPTATYCSFG